jgi:predicted RNA binding protein YcfA (HicA-like mRNA interferase family)
VACGGIVPQTLPSASLLAQPEATTSTRGPEIYLSWYTLIVSGREVIRKLVNAGWREARVSGSHHILQKDGKSVPVPVHGGRDLGVGLLRKIEKQTGVKLT